MNQEGYRFKVGTFECTAVSDGTNIYAPPTFPPPPAFLFANAPREILAQVLNKHGLQLERWTEWTSTYTCLLIKTGEHTVLVDTGADGLAPGTGKLVQNLKAVGIAPEHIDTVIITHGHPDHLGGTLTTRGGRFSLTPGT
jgi:glyoxylase-like metal-dependent hydrolase (beta-lactamase superfamily II)